MNTADRIEQGIAKTVSKMKAEMESGLVKNEQKLEFLTRLVTENVSGCVFIGYSKRKRSRSCCGLMKQM